MKELARTVERAIMTRISSGDGECLVLCEPLAFVIDEAQRHEVVRSGFIDRNSGFAVADRGDGRDMERRGAGSFGNHARTQDVRAKDSVPVLAPG